MRYPEMIQKKIRSLKTKATFKKYDCVLSTSLKKKKKSFVFGNLHVIRVSEANVFIVVKSKISVNVAVLSILIV